MEPELDLPRSIVDRLIGQRPWAATLGYGTMLTLDFGNRLPVEDGVSRPRGEFHLWIHNAVWRIERDAEMIASSAADENVMEVAIRKFAGRTVESIGLNSPGLDLTLKAEGGLVLRTFGLSDEWEHWMLFVPDKMVLAAGPGSAWNYTSDSDAAGQGKTALPDSSDN